MPDSKQIVLHQVDPIALDLGTWNLPLLGSVHPQVHWYGLMYLLGFIVAWWLGRRRVRAGRLPGVDDNGFGDLMFYAMLGVVLGGRIGYILFYDFASFIANPLMIFRVWEGGMSFHGATLKAQFDSGILDSFARHPSQLYQATLEGLVMFCVLVWYSRKPRPRYAVSGLFALLYGCFRFLVEFVREPDAQLGYLAFGWVTMGQVLSLPLILLGLYWCWKSHSSPTLMPQPAAEAAK